MLLQDEIMGRCTICGNDRHTTNGVCHECALILECEPDRYGAVEEIERIVEQMMPDAEQQPEIR